MFEVISTKSGDYKNLRSREEFELIHTNYFEEYELQTPNLFVYVCAHADK